MGEKSLLETLGIIAGIFWPVILFILYLLVTRIIKLVRFVFPSKSEKAALEIANEKSECVKSISNFDYRINREKEIENHIALFENAINKNKKKIGILDLGLKKIGAFSKNKIKKITAKKEALEKDNNLMQEQKNIATGLLYRMRWFLSAQSATVGSTIVIGNYRWIVLQKNGTNLLLVCLPVISATYNNCGWENGSLRYCCQKLYSKLSDFEKQFILTTTVKTPNERTTSDKIFVLSPEELDNLPGGKWRIAQWENEATRELDDMRYDYSEGYGGRLEKHFNGLAFDIGWFLRSAQGTNIWIDPKGNMLKNHEPSWVCGFRPSMWITIK